MIVYCLSLDLASIYYPLQGCMPTTTSLNQPLLLRGVGFILRIYTFSLVKKDLATNIPLGFIL